MERIPTWRATGTQGSWFATVRDEKLPCAWKWHLINQRSDGGLRLHYFDRGAMPDETKWVTYAEAIKRLGRVALTGGYEDANRVWRRDGYIAVYTVENVQLAEARLEFDLVDKLAHLVPRPSNRHPDNSRLTSGRP